MTRSLVPMVSPALPHCRGQWMGRARMRRSAKGQALKWREEKEDDSEPQVGQLAAAPLLLSHCR